MKKIVILLIALSCLTACGNNLSCPKGYEIDGTLCKKEIDREDPVDNKCPSDYELKNNVCYKYAIFEIQ